MPTTSYENMSDYDLEAKRNEIQLRIEALRADFMAMGKVLDGRRQKGESVQGSAELEAQIVKLKAQLAAQKPKTFIQKVFGGG